MMTIHVLWGGFAICGFSGEVPENWPIGHGWIGPSDVEKGKIEITCRGCKEQVERMRRVGKLNQP